MKDAFAVVSISRDDIINALDDDAGDAAIATINAFSDAEMAKIAQTCKTALMGGDFWYTLRLLAEDAMATK